MSNPNFVSDLVAMAKAFEELPMVREELASKAHELDGALHRLSDREKSIINLKHQIEQLHAKVRSTEAERDDAELRFLESEDRTARALDFIRSTFGSAGSLIQALEPPAPAPIPVPPAEPEVKHQDPWTGNGGGLSQPIDTDAPSPQGQSDYTPTAPSSTMSGGEDTGGTSAHFSSEAQTSDANPTVHSLATDGSQSVSAEPSSTAETMPSASMPDDVGYHNEPDVHNWQDWNEWCTRMQVRYPDAWPTRPATF